MLFSSEELGLQVKNNNVVWTKNMEKQRAKKVLLGSSENTFYMKTVLLAPYGLGIY